MARGVRVNLPPLHNLTDVVGLLLFALAIALLLRWLFMGGSLLDVADAWGSAGSATIIEIQLALSATEPLPASLAAGLAINEGAIRSRALDAARDVGGALLAAQGSWRAGSIRCARVSETQAPSTWLAAWQRLQAAVPGTPAGGNHTASPGDIAGNSQAQAPSEIVVTLLVLISGAAIRNPRRVTTRTISHALEGIVGLDLRHIGGFAAVNGVAAGAAHPRLVALAHI